jgi:RNA polymerase sigma-70 factor (ECF subfamily)
MGMSSWGGIGLLCHHLAWPEALLGVSVGAVIEPGVDPDRFRTFVTEAEQRLSIALASAYGPDDGREATAEALAYLWEHWERLMGMDNPIGYLYRVGQTYARRLYRSRRRVVPDPPTASDPIVGPGLVPALRRLSTRQRQAVVLVHGYGFTQQEVGDLLGISRSSVQRHLERGLDNLKDALGVQRL